MLLNLVPKLSMIWFHLDCIMQLKESCFIATNVCSRKSGTTFGDLPDWLSHLVFSPPPPPTPSSHSNHPLTHWGQVTHICVSNLTIIGSDNGLSPGRRPAIIWTNAGILLIGPLGTKFSEILIGIQPFLFKKLHLKTSSAKWRLFFSASMSYHKTRGRMRVCVS